MLKGSRETEELLLALIKNDVKLVYKKIEEGADVNFEFGRAYGSKEGYTPLMCACHRGRLEAAKALLRSGADPNYKNHVGDLTLFWAIDGGPEMQDGCEWMTQRKLENFVEYDLGGGAF